MNSVKCRIDSGRNGRVNRWGGSGYSMVERKRVFDVRGGVCVRTARHGTVVLGL